jgi:hypothetical protein
MNPRAAALAEQLARWSRKRVPLADLWAMFDRAAPATAGSAQRRQLLLDALEELVVAGIITTFKTIDDGSRPPLPRFVQRVERIATPAPRARVIWHPELRWADEMRMSEAQAEQLMAVNRWLFAGGAESSLAPLHERAYEITRDEKAFDGARLFGGRLTHELLRAYRVPLPLHVVRVGDGLDLLVVENGDTFDSLRRTLISRPGSIGRVAWGAGAAFEASVLSLAEADAIAPAKIHYFGDLDVAGLRIPASASALAVEAGLAPVRPATVLYTALLASGHPQAGQPRVRADRARELAAWLDPQHRVPAAELLERGQRLAQEAVGLAALQNLSDWPPEGSVSKAVRA